MEDAERLSSLKTIATLVYALQAAGFFVGISWIAAAVVDYVKKEDAAGTWLESHLRWQIRTFWFGLLWVALAGAFYLVGLLTLIVLVGFPIVAIGWAIAFADGVWLIYRVVKGWLYLSENRPMPG